MDPQQMERCLKQVAAYRASGQKAREWAEANGVAAGSLQSWCAHPKPFIWAKSARDILQKVVRANSRLRSKQNETLQ